ncbi:hypothetical protein [Paracraurococcus lichenis]|uniref:Uncharacterized protein n=1 Tax=Paracraurococcus lichenis TaxID=3064888 RepID=A0ABT9DZ53_9PROT|nr:hypothetical protein [Paracraurococcus sp. LOR1-02]MDO9709186.1 hypothetical protein [Paracraurococcus sp. LOR1-02]
MSDLADGTGTATIGDRLLIGAGNLFFDLVGTEFRWLGWDTADQNLDRYRSVQGGTAQFPDDVAERHPAFAAAEQANRLRFESLTFPGRTSAPRVNSQLRNWAMATQPCSTIGGRNRSIPWKKLGDTFGAAIPTRARPS